jgi:predicted aspartyl protease
MRFELVFPWTDWTIKTVVGGRSIDAKIDSGASLTLVGWDNAKALGINTAFTGKQPCVRYSGVSGKSDGYARAVQ